MGSWPFDVFSGHNSQSESESIPGNPMETKDSDRRPRCFAAEGDKTCMDCGCLVDFIFSDSLETS